MFFDRWCTHRVKLPRVNWNVFAILGDFCAVGSQLRAHENTSRVASGCLRLLPGTPDAVTHPIKSVLEFRRLLLLVRRCSYPQVKCKRWVGGCFCLILWTPNFDQFRLISTTAAPQSRGVGLCWNPQTANLKRITSSVDETLLTGQVPKTGTPVHIEPKTGFINMWVLWLFSWSHSLYDVQYYCCMVYTTCVVSEPHR